MVTCITFFHQKIVMFIAIKTVVYCMGVIIKVMYMYFPNPRASNNVKYKQ